MNHHTKDDPADCRDPSRSRPGAGPGWLWPIALLCAASSVPAQVVHVDAGIDQSFTSIDGLDSPVGFRLAVTGSGLWGGLGAQLVVRRLSESAGVIPQYCGFAFCTQGPFDRSYALWAAGLGITVNVQPLPGTDLVVAGNASLYRQAQKLEHLVTGDRSERDRVGPDPGFGVSADLRLPTLFLRIRPLVYIRYDHVLGNECLADAACFGGRDIASIGAGLAWRL